ncbi:MAG: T9SS type A sorting domain-containing protein [Saprospiraceae bacterium]
MKTKLTLFLSLFFLVNAVSSQSTMFPTDNAEWKYYFRFGGYNTDYGATQEIAGDSLYGGYEYQIITASGNTFTGDDSGMFREEDHRVYFIPKDSINEIVLYDFNLSVGDTFYIDPYHQASTEEFNVVAWVDTIITFDNVPRKRMVMNQGSNWIEGVGAEFGSFTFPMHFLSVSGIDYLYCLTNDSIDVFEKQFSVSLGYYEEDIYGCNGVISSNKNLIHNNAFTISPNPFADRVVVLVEDGRAVESLSLFNISSELIAQEKDTQTLDLGNLVSSGLYFLAIEIDGKTYFEKIVKM